MKLTALSPKCTFRLIWTGSSSAPLQPGVGFIAHVAKEGEAEGRQDDRQTSAMAIQAVSRMAVKPSFGIAPQDGGRADAKTQEAHPRLDGDDRNVHRGRINSGPMTFGMICTRRIRRAGTHALRT